MSSAEIATASFFSEWIAVVILELKQFTAFFFFLNSINAVSDLDILCHVCKRKNIIGYSTLLSVVICQIRTTNSKLSSPLDCFVSQSLVCNGKRSFGG